MNRWKYIHNIIHIIYLHLPHNNLAKRTYFRWCDVNFHFKIFYLPNLDINWFPHFDFFPSVFFISPEFFRVLLRSFFVCACHATSHNENFSYQMLKYHYSTRNEIKAIGIDLKLHVNANPLDQMEWFFCTWIIHWQSMRTKTRIITVDFITKCKKREKK